MKVLPTLASANFIVLFCLIFTCGCQNESAATKTPTKKPPRIAYTTPPPDARALDGSDQDATNPLLEDEEDEEEEVEAPFDGAQVSFEYEDPGTLGSDTREADAFLMEASQR